MCVRWQGAIFPDTKRSNSGKNRLVCFGRIHILFGKCGSAQNLFFFLIFLSLLREQNRTEMTKYDDDQMINQFVTNEDDTQRVRVR